jgi:hypothetical protein
VERYHVPNYLRARCIFFKKFLEDKKNDGEDLNYESFYMGLTLDDFMACKDDLSPKCSICDQGAEVSADYWQSTSSG